MTCTRYPNNPNVISRSNQNNNRGNKKIPPTVPVEGLQHWHHTHQDRVFTKTSAAVDAIQTIQKIIISHPVSLPLWNWWRSCRSLPQPPRRSDRSHPFPSRVKHSPHAWHPSTVPPPPPHRPHPNTPPRSLQSHRVSFPATRTYPPCTCMIIVPFVSACVRCLDWRISNTIYSFWPMMMSSLPPI